MIDLPKIITQSTQGGFSYLAKSTQGGFRPSGGVQENSSSAVLVSRVETGTPGGGWMCLSETRVLVSLSEVLVSLSEASCSIDLFRLRKTVFGKSIFINPSGLRVLVKVRMGPGPYFPVGKEIPVISPVLTVRAGTSEGSRGCLDRLPA